MTLLMPTFKTNEFRSALRLLVLAAAAGATALSTGCGVFGVVSKVGEAIESEKQVEVLARYRGLENKTIAVVVNADRSVHYEYPTVVPYVTSSVAGGVRNRVSGVTNKVMEAALPALQGFADLLASPEFSEAAQTFATTLITVFNGVAQAIVGITNAARDAFEFMRRGSSTVGMTVAQI